MFPLVLLFKAGVACCLPTCAQGSSVPVMRNAVFGVFLGFLFFFLCAYGEYQFYSLPVVYKIWVVKVCLLLEMPFGQRSVGALPWQPPGRILKSSQHCLQVCWDVCGILDVGAVHASLSGTAQSPWL